jgi:putative protease
VAIGARPSYLFRVAQICNLPYRRFAIGRASANTGTFDFGDTLQDAILRNGRLQICATTEGGHNNQIRRQGRTERMHEWRPGRTTTGPREYLTQNSILMDSTKTSFSSVNQAETALLAAIPPASPARARLPELLAPAGDWECARAAVENGADAIYFGLERFNARMRAHNFTEGDLPRLMEFLHKRGVKGYVTFNTLVFANELAEAEQYLRTIIAAGVDAAIVQDVGICRLIRRISPDFPIHASTQMTITSAAGVEFARELGCQLVVLARECSLKEIDKIVSAAETDAPGQPGDSSQHHNPRPSLPLEVFVHGALCVAYSGQCLTSEALGGRSANRGECAQACRMPYELISDGQEVALGDRRYLLSPQDLAGLEVLPELIRSGVASLKIEGRLKTPEYVASITRVYRQALDHADAGPQSQVPTSGSRKREHAITADIAAPTSTNNADSRYDMEMAFSRGLFSGWFRGINNQELVHARFGKKRGVYLGAVSRLDGGSVILRLEGPLKPGDGIVFDAGHPDQKEEGGRVYQVEKHGAETRLSFGHGDIDFQRIQVGDKLWKTSDPELDRRVRLTFTGEKPNFRRPLQIEVHGRSAQLMTVIARDELGHVVQIDSAMPLARAEKQPLSTERLRDQLGRLGATAFELREMKNLLQGPVILPMSELNRLRRELVAQMETLRARPKRWQLNVDEVVPAPTFGFDSSRPASPSGVAPGDRSAPPSKKVNLIVLVRNLDQLEAALSSGIAAIYCEFEDPKKYRPAVTRFREWHAAQSDPAVARPQSASGSEIFVAPPRITKMGEEWILKLVRSCEADGYLVRNYDHLKFFAEARCVGDFSLNIANPWTADYFRNKFGLERVTASYDLNFTQLEALLRSAPPEWFEITLHQHIPMFHMEHCVFCAFLSSGTDYTNCGRPCDKHDVRLRDRVGAEHPLKADAGCRNTVFHALAQTGAEYASRMLGLGVRHFRIEFLNETADQVTQTVSKYRQLLRGEITGTELWRELKLLNQLGVTRGQMGSA